MRALPQIALLMLTVVVIGCDPSFWTSAEGEGEGGGDAIDPVLNGPDAASLTTYWSGPPCLISYGQGFCSSSAFNFALATDGTAEWSVDGRFATTTWTRLGPDALVIDLTPLDLAQQPSLNFHDIVGSVSGGAFTAAVESGNGTNFVAQTGDMPGFCACDSVLNATATCDGNACSYSGACDPGALDCDGEAGNGCEIDVATTCANGQVRSASGVSYSCVTHSCDYAACDADAFDCDGARQNGCETELASVCSGGATVSGATYDCDTGCDYTACNQGFLDCDGDKGNGCELDEEAACGSNLHATGSTFSCQDGRCTDYTACEPGFCDVDGDRANGCERPTFASCPVELAKGSARGIVVDAPNVYWVGTLNLFGTLKLGAFSTPIGGGTTTPLGDPDISAGGGVFVDATDVYWGDGGGIVHTAKTGAGTTNLLVSQGGVVLGGVDADNVYWAQGSDVSEKGLLAGSPVPLLSKAGGFTGLTLDGGDIFALGPSGAWQIPLDRSTVIELDAQHPTPTQGGIIVSNGVDVFWRACDGLNTCGIWQQQRGGVGAPIELIDDGNDVHSPLAVDGTSIFWIDDNGVLSATSIAGGGTTPIAVAFPLALTVDATNVYWAESSGVYSVAK